MNKIERHLHKVEQLQRCVKNFNNASGPLSLHDPTGHSNTTRTKTYKHPHARLDLSQLNEVIHLDLKKKVALVEPRVTMEALLHATFPYQLIPPVLPEFRGMTVGGAIMGGAGESGSHRWGAFNDICLSYELIDGAGNFIHASPKENADLHYGIAGSYGSLGALVLAEIQLIPAHDSVYLNYHPFSTPLEAIDKMRSLFHSCDGPDFIDGMIFSKHLAVVIEGRLQLKEQEAHTAPLFSLHSSSSPWFYQHAKTIAASVPSQTYRERMSVEDYFFRYDLGGFWMGTYLFRLPFLMRFLSQGIGRSKWLNREGFSEKEIQRFHQIQDPPNWGRALFNPFLKSQNLWALLHKAEQWIQKRILIQDFCIPESNVPLFCKDILENPAIFPIWLCPMKGTKAPQIFAPHFLAENCDDRYVVNFGIYGIPAQAASIRQATQMLEQIAYNYGGRKTLYSHSYYTLDEFWQIYPRTPYENLRSKTKAHGVWHDIIDKVLSN